MKRTLLDLTQNLLSALGSDEVNSISDTTESMQIAEIIRTTYFNIVSRAELTSDDQLFQLTAATDADTPVMMYRPDNVTKIDVIKYNDTSDTADYKDVTIQTPVDFLNRVNLFNPDDTDVDSFTFNNITFRYKTGEQPKYCTILQNYYIIFDSYDNTVDDTLQTSKTLCIGQTIPSFRMEDTFVPELDDYQFPLLLNEAKSLAFLELKQMMHPKAEKESKRQWNNLQKGKSLADAPSAFDALPNYGRK